MLGITYVVDADAKVLDERALLAINDPGAIGRNLEPEYAELQQWTDLPSQPERAGGDRTLSPSPSMNIALTKEAARERTEFSFRSFVRQRERHVTFDLTCGGLTCGWRGAIRTTMPSPELMA